MSAATRNLTWPALVAGALLSAGVGLLAYLLTAHSIERSAEERFANLARNAHFIINARLKSYVDVLRGSASMAQIKEGLTRKQFHTYVSGLDLEARFPGIEAINYSRYVKHADLPAFVARMKAEPAGPPDHYPRFKLRPATRRDDYEILLYIEPALVWGERFGYNLLARRSNEIVMNHARDTGQISSSGVPLPILSGPHKMGLAMRLPIYRSGMPLTSIAERRAAYLGSVGLGFSVRKLVENVLQEMGAHYVRLTLTDSENHALLFDSAATPDTPAPTLPARRGDAGVFVSEIPIRFTGRTWNAVFSTDHGAVLSMLDANAPWMAGLASSTVSMLLWALFQTLASARARAVRIAGSMTRDLRESQMRLELSHQNLRRLAAHADHIKEEERKRIAREIHDDLGQNLLALRIEADLLAARTSVTHPRLHARMHASIAQIDATIRSVRQIINDLRPNVLDLGLSAAVEWLVDEFKRRNGVQCELVTHPHEIVVHDNCATAFFRILQESLSNITRHANATQVRVELRLHCGRLAMTVSDNGSGILPGTRDKLNSFGLVGIEERIRILGGSFQIDSTPGHGTSISVEVAVENPAAALPQRMPDIVPKIIALDQHSERDIATNFPSAQMPSSPTGGKNHERTQ